MFSFKLAGICSGYMLLCLVKQCLVRKAPFEGFVYKANVYSTLPPDSV